MPAIKKLVLWSWQPEIVAQCFSFVFAPENSASLQFRHHAINKIIEPTWQVRKLQREAVGALRHQPLLHLVGNRCGRANHCEPGMAAEALSELPHGKVLPLGKIDRALPAAL